MKVRFTETRILDDFRKGTPDEERYEEGGVYDLKPASAKHWLNRGAAVVVPEETPLEAPAAPVENPPSPPSGAFPESGPAKPLYVSPPVQAFAPETLNESAEPTPPESAGSLPSTDGSSQAEDAPSTRRSRMPYTRRTRDGGAPRKTRRGFKGSK